MPIHAGGINVPLEFPALLLVLGQERSLVLNFARMLAPWEGKVPSLRIGTIKIRGRVVLAVVGVFETVLYGRQSQGWASA